MKCILLSVILVLLSALRPLVAKEYKASLFGLKSDGTTNNTGSFQKAIDYISEQGGGTLVFYVGRYLTGSVTLKSNVSLRLEEGAILVGSPAVYDYSGEEGKKALLVAIGQQNITISGKGVIDGQGYKLAEHMQDQNSRGFLGGEAYRAGPALILLDSCRNISVEEINLRDACGDAVRMTHSTDISFIGITIKSKIAEESAGIRISGCDTVSIQDSFIETSGKEIFTNEASGKITLTNLKNPSGMLPDQ